MQFFKENPKFLIALVGFILTVVFIMFLPEWFESINAAVKKASYGYITLELIILSIFVFPLLMGLKEYSKSQKQVIDKFLDSDHVILSQEELDELKAKKQKSRK